MIAATALSRTLISPPRAYAAYESRWELPVLGEVEAPSAVLIRPDGYVAWVGDCTEPILVDALTTWFGAAAEA